MCLASILFSAPSHLFTLFLVPFFQSFDEKLGGHSRSEQTPPSVEALASAKLPLREKVDDLMLPRTEVLSSSVSLFQLAARVLIELCSIRIRQMAYPDLSVTDLGELVDVSAMRFIFLLLVRSRTWIRDAVASKLNFAGICHAFGEAQSACAGSSESSRSTDYFEAFLPSSLPAFGGHNCRRLLQMAEFGVDIDERFLARSKDEQTEAKYQNIRRLSITLPSSSIA